MKALLILATILLYVYCEDCNFKTSEIDWKRLEGTTWYQVLNGNDPMDIVTPCFVVRFTAATPTGAKLNFFMIDPENLDKTRVTHQEFVRSGPKYNLKMLGEAEWGEELTEEEEEEPGEPPSFSQELDDHFKYSTAIFTDYETYFMGVLCTPERRYVFANSAFPKLTVNQVLKIYNILVDNDSVELLYPAKCPNIPDIDAYLKH